jgi:polygalacturonase
MKRRFSWFGAALALTGLRAIAGDISANDFGAVGDGVTLNTAALQRAIDTCSADGGGTLILPAGRYVTGTLELKSGVTLRLARDAVLLGSTHAAVGAERVGLEGAGGAIDGQGAALKARRRGNIPSDRSACAGCEAGIFPCATCSSGVTPPDFGAPVSMPIHP